MKKFYPCFLLSCALLSVNAQLTQSNHAPVAGDQYSTWNCDTVGPGPSGAGVLWDFSSVNTHSSITRNYVASAVSSATYVNASVAVGSSITDVAYFNSTANDLVYYGGNLPITGYSVSLNYTASPAVHAAYPMSLNTTSTAAVGGSINITFPGSFTGSFSGSSMVLADGTGTVILPGGATFTNVLRVVRTETLNCALAIPVTVYQHKYDYYSPGIKAPIFSITASTLAPSFGATTTQTIVTRNKAAVPGVIDTTSVYENSANKVVLSVFPNPATGITTIEAFGANVSRALIFDVTGKLIGRMNFTDGKTTLDVSGYSNGLYIYTVIGNDGTKLGTGRITVNH